MKDPSTVTVMDSENLGNGVETGSTGERDMHSDATSEKHSPPAYNEGRRKDSSMVVSDLTPTTENSYGGGLYGTESTPSATTYDSPSHEGHASDLQSAEGLESDMPDRAGIREPPSSGNRATDITGIPYIQ